MNTLNQIFIKERLADYFKEDEFHTDFAYVSKLPQDTVECSLKFKEDMLVAGMPFFVETFRYLGAKDLDGLLEWEGKNAVKGDCASFELPFNIALTGERIALNLLQKASAIATRTSKFVKKAGPKGVKILDTRKTTPGHRALEKYAVNIGGGLNHRFGQTECWMIKDNHKTFFGGLEGAWNFFQSVGSFYRPVIVEIHDLQELEQASRLGARHLMLDNFSPEKIRQAVEMKKEGQTYEVSGGVTLENLDDYLLEGVDAISSGSLTYAATNLDISLKYSKK